MTFFPRLLSPALVLTAAALGPSDSAPAQDSGKNRQSEQTFRTEVARKVHLKYLLYLPKDYPQDESKKWPLLVFLHGAGERGDDLDLVKKHGPPKLAEAGKAFPFVVISPQCPADSWWPYEPVLELVGDVEKRLRVDPDRIYLTGLSMGGYGTWHFAAREPGKFAAIAPICGGGTPYLVQRRLPHLPIWAFHGAKDSAVPLDESERLVKALKRGGNQEVKFTVYPEAGHDSWTEAYGTEELYRWLLSHRRAK